MLVIGIRGYRLHPAGRIRGIQVRRALVGDFWLAIGFGKVADLFILVLLCNTGCCWRGFWIFYNWVLRVRCAPGGRPGR